GGGGWWGEMWERGSSRRSRGLELANGACTPPLSAPAAALPCELVPSPGWRELSDAERDAVFVNARALAHRRLDEIRAGELGHAAITALTRCLGFRPAPDAAVH